MRWRKQKSNNPNCGIIAVAVIANCSIKKAIEAIGSDGETSTEDLAKGLRKLGFKCPNKLKVFKKNIPKLAIAKVSIPDTHHWHWVAIYNDKIFDGVNGNKNGNVFWRNGWRMTSYLPIEKRITK